MSDKRQEAISDIIAEMRLGATGDMPFAYRIGRPDRIVEYKTKDGKKYVQRRAVIESVTIDELADRLDAAHKREVDNLNLVIQATVSRSDAEIDRLRRERDTLQRERDELAKDYNNAQRERSIANSKLHEMEKSVGNSAKLREALDKVLNAIKHLSKIHNDNLPEDVRATLGLMAFDANEALAAPPRNCDVGTARQQEKRHKEEACLKSACPKHEGFVSKACKGCFAMWSQMPYKGGAT